MIDYQLTKEEKRILWREGWIAHINGQPMKCPHPTQGGTGSILDAWGQGWWSREYWSDPASPLYNPEIVKHRDGGSTFPTRNYYTKEKSDG